MPSQQCPGQKRCPVRHHPPTAPFLWKSQEHLWRMQTEAPFPPGAHLLPLHHVEQVSEGRVLGVVEGQQGQRALHLGQALPALLALLSQLGLRELQRRLRLPLADQLDQVLLLVGGQADGVSTGRLATRPVTPPRPRLLLMERTSQRTELSSNSKLLHLHF